jgi:cobalt/nickel-transporting P-type ATPase D
MSPHERRRFQKKKGLSLSSNYKTTALITSGIHSNTLENGENHLDNDNDKDPGSEDHHNNGSSISREVGALESDKRLSLLGHGPHGKLVVEKLLEKYGEEGILQFCQKWRQVFVEALHPKFLPGGWNIMHRLS